MYSDKLEIHTLELPKLAKHDYPETELLDWMRFINAETKEELEMVSIKNPYIQKAYKNLEEISALIRTCQDFGLTSSDTVSRLCQMFSISPENAREYIQKYWDDNAL